MKKLYRVEISRTWIGYVWTDKADSPRHIDEIVSTENPEEDVTTVEVRSGDVSVWPAGCLVYAEGNEDVRMETVWPGEFRGQKS